MPFNDITLEFDAECNTPLTAALEMLAYVLAALPPDAREARLQELEDRKLRVAVGSYVVSRTQRQPFNPYPKTPLPN